MKRRDAKRRHQQQTMHIEYRSVRRCLHRTFAYFNTKSLPYRATEKQENKRLSTPHTNAHAHSNPFGNMLRSCFKRFVFSFFRRNERHHTKQNTKHSQNIAAYHLRSCIFVYIHWRNRRYEWELKKGKGEKER